MSFKTGKILYAREGKIIKFDSYSQRGYTKHLMTEKDRISYYVQPKQFEHDFPKGSKERLKVERQVKQDYIEVLRNNCYQETLNGLYLILP